MSELPEDTDCQTVKALLDNGADVLLLDCRTPQEFETVHIQSARLIPMQEIQQRVGELDDERDRHIVVYCHHGGRSAMVAGWLREQGFSQVQNMTGGIDQWAQQIEPTLPRY